MATDAITVQVVGNRDKLEDFLRIVEPFGVRELVQSGMVAIGRGGRSISERTLRPVVRARPARGRPSSTAVRSTADPADKPTKESQTSG